MRQGVFEEEWELHFAAYSRQRDDAGKGHSLRDGPRPRDAHSEQVCSKGIDETNKQINKLKR